MDFSSTFCRRRTIILWVIILAFALLSHARNSVWQGGLSLWGDVVAKSPAKARGYTNLGAALVRLGRHEEALPFLSKAVELSPPHDSLALFNKGTSLREMGRLEEALTALQEAVALNPRDFKSNNTIGLIHVASKRWELAQASFEKSLAIYPLYPEALSNLASLLYEQGEVAKAIPYLQKALSADPRYAVGHYGLGNALLRLGRLPEAVQSFRRAILYRPEHVDAHVNLGVALKGLGDLPSAISQFKKALEIDPEGLAGLYNLGISYAESGDFPRALSVLEIAAKLYPDDQDIITSLQMVRTIHLRQANPAIPLLRQP